LISRLEKRQTGTQLPFFFVDKGGEYWGEKAQRGIVGANENVNIRSK